MLLLYYILQGYIAWRNALAKLKMVLGGIRPGMFPYFCWCLLHRCQLLPLNIFLQTSVIRFPKGIRLTFTDLVHLSHIHRFWLKSIFKPLKHYKPTTSNHLIVAWSSVDLDSMFFPDFSDFKCHTYTILCDSCCLDLARTLWYLKEGTMNVKLRY